MPVYIDLSSIKKRLKLDGRAQAFLTSTVAKHMKKYVPYSGDGDSRYHLNENVTLTPNTITYEMPYAHAQYVGFTTGPVTHYTTPGTGPYWDKRMLSQDKETIKKELVNYMTRGGY